MRRRYWWITGCLLLLVPLGTACLSQRAEEGATPTLVPRETIRLSDGVWQLVVSPDSQAVVSFQERPRSAQLLDLRAGVVSDLELVTDTEVMSIAISRDGVSLAVGGSNGSVRVLDLASRAIRNSLTLGNGNVTWLAWDRDGRYVFAETRRDAEFVRRVDLTTGSVKTVCTRARVPIRWHGSVRVLAIAPDSSDLVLGMGPGAIVWNLQTACERFACSLRESDGCTHAAFSPDGKMLAIADVNVEVWNRCQGQRLRALPHHVPSGRTCTLGFSPDGQLLVAGVSQGVPCPSYLVVWKASNYSRPIVFRCHDEFFLRTMAFVPGTHKLVTGCFRLVQVWDLDRLSWGDTEEPRKDAARTKRP